MPRHDPLSTSFTPRAPPALNTNLEMQAVQGKVQLEQPSHPPGVCRAVADHLYSCSTCNQVGRGYLHPEHEHESIRISIKSSLYINLARCTHSDVLAFPQPIGSEDSLHGHHDFYICDISQFISLDKFPQPCTLIFYNPSFAINIVHAGVDGLSFLFNLVKPAEGF